MGVGSLPGCSGPSEPQMEFQRFVVPDPNVVTVDTEGDEYFATIQNRGESGNIRVELWYFRDSDTPSPSAPSIYQNNTHEGRHFDLARGGYFSAGERREVSIIGSEDSPTWEGSREFGMFPWPASHGAVFENSGDAGEVEFRFEYRDTGQYDPAEPANKLDTVSSDSTIEVVFDTVVPPSAEYEIIAEPV